MKVGVQQRKAFDVSVHIMDDSLFSSVDVNLHLFWLVYDIMNYFD